MLTLLSPAPQQPSPSFTVRSLKKTAVAVAIGSHEPDSRELDDTLMSRASVYVESLSSSQPEAGEIVQARAPGQ